MKSGTKVGHKTPELKPPKMPFTKFFVYGSLETLLVETSTFVLKTGSAE